MHSSNCRISHWKVLSATLAVAHSQPRTPSGGCVGEIFKGIRGNLLNPGSWGARLRIRYERTSHWPAPHTLFGSLELLRQGSAMCAWSKGLYNTAAARIYNPNARPTTTVKP